MKKILLSIIAVAMTTFNGNAQTKLYDFPFNNSYNATVGTDTFARTLGTSFTTDRRGNKTGAINIISSGTTATLLKLPYGNAARTVSLWVKLNIIRADYNFLFSYGTAATADGSFITPSTARSFLPNHISDLTHSVNIWYHFVFTYDKTTSRIYRNGTLISTLAVAKNTITNGNIFTLGLSDGGSEGLFDGAIDDLKIYDYALSNAEVVSLYNLPTATNDLSVAEKLIAVYPNPTVNQINFSVQANVQMTNATGQIVADKKNVNALDITEQPVGIYFVTFKNDQGIVLQHSKIVKK